MLRLLTLYRLSPNTLPMSSCRVHLRVVVDVLRSLAFASRCRFWVRHFPQYLGKGIRIMRITLPLLLHSTDRLVAERRDLKGNLVAAVVR
jgi:hypothetical protein